MRKTGFIWMSVLVLLAGHAGAANREQTRSDALADALAQPECRAIEPFYWEVGNAGGVLASGSAGRDAPGPSTVMPVASATKWLFGAYVVQVRAGQLTPQDIQALVMQTGYVSHRHPRCVKRRDAKQAAFTVAECFAESALAGGRNDEFTPAAVGQFNYNGGHFQAWAVQNGLGELNNATLAQRFNAVLGTELQIGFESPQLAGGARMSGAQYGRFLRKLLAGELQLGAMLGQRAVCTDARTCPGKAGESPLPPSLHWQYSLGHWVEPDAFSSAGAFGFYPWIAKDRSHYGVIAREKRALLNRPAPDSVACGQLLRRALAGLAAQD
ncbi:MAG: hypothetical protein R3F38_13880 [Gammaproteobacteria bacterium]